MDVEATFHHEELDEMIFMGQPEGFVSKGHEHKVWRFKLSIYGMKQSSKQWYLRFHRAILLFGFPMVEKEDHCV